MKNWKFVALLAVVVGMSSAAFAQGGQGKMSRNGGGTQQIGQGSAGGQGTLTRSQSRTQDGTHVGGEEALRERIRSQTPTTTVTQ